MCTHMNKCLIAELVSNAILQYPEAHVEAHVVQEMRHNESILGDIGQQAGAVEAFR